MIHFFHSLLSNNDSEINIITEVGEKMAYTWFGRPNWAQYENKYWIGSTASTEGGITQHISEFNLETEDYTTTQVGNTFEYDDHNQAQILIRKSDNRLIAFFVEHSGAKIRWRISTNPLDSTSWGTINEYNPVNGYSYISPYQSTDGNIFLFFRATVSSGYYKWYYVKSTDDGNTFGNLVEVIDNGNTQNYCITVQEVNKLHFVSSNGHPNNNPTLNISMYHFYFDMISETFHKTDGTLITTPFTVSNTTLVNLTTDADTSWNLDISIKDGKPRILYAFYPSGKNTSLFEKELWFKEWNGVAWVNNTKISHTMSGYIEKDMSVQEKAYTGASRFHTSKPDIIIMPKHINGVLELHKVDISDINNIYIEQLTFNSIKDNWRPICLDFPKNNLIWLRNDKYDMYNNFDIVMMSKTII